VSQSLSLVFRLILAFAGSWAPRTHHGDLGELVWMVCERIVLSLCGFSFGHVIADAAYCINFQVVESKNTL
jgi:hypothetical protein